MKMTKEQVAELMLKADLDCRNLEYLDNWNILTPNGNWWRIR